MVKSHLIGRMGSKTNDIKFFKHLLPMDVNIVVEPFGGSFAVIRDIYNDKKYEKYVNDTDTELFFIYQNPELLIESYELVNNIIKVFYNQGIKKVIEEIGKLEIHSAIKNYLLKNQIVRGYVAKIKNVNDSMNDLYIMGDINFSNDDAFSIIDKFKENKNAFIFLDPPYLFSDNSQYGEQNIDTDNTDFYLKFLEVLKDKKTKAKIMLIINDLKILRVLYKDYIKGDYGKIYQVCKKKARHLIIANY